MRFWHNGMVDHDISVYPEWTSLYRAQYTVLDGTLYSLHTHWEKVMISEWAPGIESWITLNVSNGHMHGLSHSDWVNRILVDLPSILVLFVI